MDVGKRLTGIELFPVPPNPLYTISAYTSAGRAGPLTAMSWLTTLALYLIHGLFSTLSLLASIPRRLRQKPPLPLNATRRQIPTHLALLLVPDEREDSEQLEGTLVDIALRVIEWCRVVGVNRLTIYDRQGAYHYIIIRTSGK